MAQLNDLLVLGNSNLLGDANIFGTLGIYDNLNIDGNVSINSTTDSTATTNGALIVKGGVGIAKQLRVAGNTTLSGTLSVTGTSSFHNLMTVSFGDKKGIKLGGAYITSCVDTGEVVLQGGHLRFGSSLWDYNTWAGLKYIHTDSNNTLIKTIYLGLAENNIFTANTPQSEGTLSLPGIRYLVINGKTVIDAGDTWLRINQGNAHSSGVYFGTSITRTDGRLEVGNSGDKFYANNLGNGYFRNTLRIGAISSNTSLDGNWCEGIRINVPDGQWATIALGTTDFSGTNPQCWSIHRTSNNDFNISKASSDGVNGLVMTDIGMGLGTTSPSYRLQVNGSIGANGNIYIGTNSGAGNGLSLYSTSPPNNYGIHMSYTSTYGTYGKVTSDWATYFCFDGDNSRGWIFRHAGTNVFSINGRGTLSIGHDIPGIVIRQNHASYDAVLSYQTSGDEAMLFTTKNAATSFMFVNGEDTVTNISSSRWTNLTPGLQIKNNCVAIGGLIQNGVTPSYKLWVNGTGNFSGHLYANNGLTWTNAYWTAPGNIFCEKNGTGAEFSFDMGAGTQWHVWSTPNGASMLSCFSDNKYVQVHHHLQVGNYNNSSYTLTTDSFICNSWIRTKGQTGWFNEDYGGGWYMTDTTYIRAYNDKQVYVSNTGQHAIYTAGGFASATTSGAVFSTYYNGTWYETLRTHGNGNLTVDAPGGSLYLAYYRGNTYFAGGTYYIDRNGYFNGGTAYLVRQSSTALDSAGADNFFSDGKLQWAAVNSSTYGNDGSIISLGWNSQYGSQIWIDDGGRNGGMAVRSRSGSGWNPWKTLIKSNSATYYGAGNPPATGASAGDVYFKYI